MEKQKYKGTYNWHGELVVLWTHAINEKAAKRQFISQLADKLSRPQWAVRRNYTGTKANFHIKEIRGSNAY